MKGEREGGRGRGRERGGMEGERALRVWPQQGHIQRTHQGTTDGVRERKLAARLGVREAEGPEDRSRRGGERPALGLRTSRGLRKVS